MLYMYMTLKLRQKYLTSELLEHFFVDFKAKSLQKKNIRGTETSYRVYTTPVWNTLKGGR